MPIEISDLDSTIEAIQEGNLGLMTNTSSCLTGAAEFLIQNNGKGYYLTAVHFPELTRFRGFPHVVVMSRKPKLGEIISQENPHIVFDSAKGQGNKPTYQVQAYLDLTKGKVISAAHVSDAALKVLKAFLD